MYFEKNLFRTNKNKKGEKSLTFEIYDFFFSLTEIFDAVSRVFNHKQIQYKNKIMFHFYSCETYKIILLTTSTASRVFQRDAFGLFLFYKTGANVDNIKKKLFYTIILCQVCVHFLVFFSRSIIWIRILIEKNLHKTMR